MSVFLILFFISLAGIIVLLGQKILAIGGDFRTPANFEFVISVPDFEDLRKTINKKSRRYGYIALVIAIRLYVLAAHFIKNKSRMAWNFIKSKIARKNKVAKKEAENRFLHRISEYKNRIKIIKDKIRQEEGLN